jgi:acyl transferase domain-containing protein/acyl carrier protein
VSDKKANAATQPVEGKAGDRKSVLQDALSAIERLQAKLAATESAAREPIAIVGLGCRLPGGAKDAASYWDILSEGRDVVSEVPSDRWDVDAYYDPDPTRLGKARTKSGGFLDRIDGFDPSFFGMSPREATGLDPQQRLLLEVAWEALENAAIPPDTLDGSLTGVFVGITSMDYASRIDVADPARSDIYLATGTALNAAAGRVSFTLGLQGPCMAIDTACSSSLVAIHTACQSLRNRESDLVLAGGVNVILSPDPFVLISKWGMLSPDGRCKTFDASANGFVRGEGCGLIVLERLSDALANGRTVLAVIRGSAINQDGRSSGLTVPNGLAQQAVVRHALHAANVQASDISYVEAHGTGTSLGDPIEVEALAAVYGEGRPADRPFEIGSVKSNIGHLEAASGVAGLIKLVLAMQQRKLPASLHVRQPTPAIAWDSIPVRISTSLHDWNPPQGRRLAGISAFGFSGMNAHVIVEEPPQSPAQPLQPERSHVVLPLSARSETALATLAARYEEHLLAHPEQTLADICGTAAVGRAQFTHRLALIASDRTAMAAQLRAAIEGAEHIQRGASAPSRRTKVGFLFTGQGSQYVGMGRSLYASEPVFRDVIDRCAAVLDPLLERPLRTVLFEDRDGALNQTGYTQPALYAIEVALAALWRHWGIEPSVVIGHSVGEFAAAAVAGVFSIEDGARLIAARGRLMQALPAGGVMVAVQAEAALVEREVARHAASVSLAAWNAPNSLVIAGAHAPVEQIVERLQAQNIRTQPLTVSHAFHSPLMRPMVRAFQQVAAGIAHAAPTLTWISNLTAAPLDWAAWGERMSEYWARHVESPVLFERGMQALAASGCDVFLEVGPHPVLTGLGKLCLPDATSIEWLASLRQGRAEAEQMLESVARLYVRGSRLNWRAIQGHRAHPVALPTYPFQRQRYILDMKSGSRRASGKSVHELLGARLSVAGSAAQFERIVSRADPAWVADHGIGAGVLMPLTAYLEAGLAAARQVFGSQILGLDAVEVGEPLVLAEEADRVLQVAVDRTPPRVRVFSRDAAREDAEWSVHMSAAVDLKAPEPPVQEESLTTIATRCSQSIDIPQFYDKLRDLGVDFGPAFRGLERAWSGEGEALGDVACTPAVAADAGKYLLHPAFLDGCFHVSAIVMDTLPGAGEHMYLPIGVDRFRCFAAATGPVRSYARARDPSRRGEMIVLDVRIETPGGDPIATIEGLRCRRVNRDAMQQRAEAQVAEWLYDLIWKEVALPSTPNADAGGEWLIFEDDQGKSTSLAEELERRGGAVTRVSPGESYSVAAGRVQIDPTRAAHYEKLVRQVPVGQLRGIVSLWPLRIPALRDDAVPSSVQQFGTDAALLLIQALTGQTATCRVAIVTSGSQVADASEAVRIEQCPVAGLARVAAAEHPELGVKLIDLDAQAGAAEVRLLVEELLSDSDEGQIAFRKGARLAARFARKAKPASRNIDESPIRLNIGTRGTLENLTIAPAARRPPNRGEIEVRVRASGLNFRDVLSALGMYPGEIRHLGSDCAGEVVAVGEDVKGFAIGDRVVAMVEGAFASHATTRWEFVAPLPAGLDFEQGAAIPTAYLTADITLNQIGGMKRGHRVLIHSGAGGVGMAAIALAQRAGAEIFATAGNPEKRAFLQRLGAHHVFDSRSTAFGDEIMRITGGKGVDMVLNSLAGAMLDRSFEVLAEGGVFLEIGKRGVWTHERAAALGRGIRYYIVDCNDNARETPTIVGATFARVLADIESGVLPVLPCTTFPFERAIDAFRYMAQAKHIGRVVFRHEVALGCEQTPVNGDATYLVTGGTKGLGLLAAQWLASEGARRLLLAARGAPDDNCQAAITALQAAGVSVDTIAADVGSESGIEQIMDRLAGISPLGGIIHCAGVLDDGVLAKQTLARFAAVMAPKADGAWRLHRAIAARGHKPAFFAMYSSMSAVFGSPGQGNYVAANSFLDGLAFHRYQRGLPAVSVNWGAWKEVGMAARGATAMRAGAQGLGALSPAEGMQSLGVLLRNGVVRASVSPIDWSVLAAQFESRTAPAMLRDALSEAQRLEAGERRGSVGKDTGVDYAALDPAQRRMRIADLIRTELATVLALGDGASSIVDDQPFTSFGLDSLTSVELRNRLQAKLGRAVAATAAFEWPTVEALAAHLNEAFAPVQADESAEPREELAL